MIKLHLGMPRIGFRNLDFIGRIVLMSEPESTILAPAKYFRSHLRPVINSRGARIVDSPLMVAANFDHVVHAISAPFLLGSPDELLLYPRARRRAASRVHSASMLFSGHSIQLHLMIMNPLLYMVRILGARALDLLRGPHLMSWSSLIEELGLSDIDHPIIVWDCDDNITTYEQFLCEFLGQPLRYISAEDGVEALQAELYTDDEINVSLNCSEEILSSYLNSYEHDLESISSMQNVTLVKAPA